MTRRWLLAALGLLAVGALWGTGLHAPFVYDDKVEVIGNPTLRVYTELSAIATYNVSRPLLILTYALNWASSGLDPVGYHLASIAIHLVNVTLVGLVVAELVNARIGAATALLWGVHPMCVQGVTYITGRSDALCALFWLAASLAWLRGDRRHSLHWTLVFVAAGLLTKELTVLLPLWLWFLTPHRRGGASGTPWRALAVMAALVVGGAALRVWMMGWPQLEVHRTVWQQAVLQAYAWDQYLRLWAAPIGQSVLHDPPALGPWPLVPLTSLILWTGAWLWVLWSRRTAPWRGLDARWPLPALGGLLVFCWLLPSGVIPLKESIAEHRAYLVGVPILALVSTGLDRLGILKPAVAGLALVLGGLTVAQNAQWSSEAALWRQAATLYPKSADANYGYADALRFQGEWAEAEAGYRLVLELREDDQNAAINLGICRAERGFADEAHAIWQEVTRKHPKACKAHDDLGAWARLHATRREALDEYLSAFRWCPTDPDALLNLGDLMWERGDTALARKYYQSYLDVLPSGAEAARARARL